MDGHQIRRAIETLVEHEIRRQGVQGMAWLNLDKWHKSTCGLVNPMCPDDLCVLPPGHVGTAEGYHLLGTMSYSHACKFPSDRMTGRRNKGWLIQEGYRRARIMFGPDR